MSVDWNERARFWLRHYTKRDDPDLYALVLKTEERLETADPHEVGRIIEDYLEAVDRLPPRQNILRKMMEKSQSDPGSESGTIEVKIDE